MAFRNPLTTLDLSATTGQLDGSRLMAGTVVADHVVAGAINGQTITGVDVIGSTFSTSGGSGSRVEIGLSGGYPTNQIRMFNGDTSVSSLRNPDDRPGNARLSTYDGAHVAMFDFFASTWDGAGHPCIQFGGAVIKSINSYATVQIRLGDDSGYAPINASVFNVMSSLGLKTNVTPLTIDALSIVGANGINAWDMTDTKATGGIGLIADDMPDWIRSPDGYDVAGALAILWEAVKQLNAKLAPTA